MEHLKITHVVSIEKTNVKRGVEHAGLFGQNFSFVLDEKCAKDMVGYYNPSTKVCQIKLSKATFDVLPATLLITFTKGPASVSIAPKGTRDCP